MMHNKMDSLFADLASIAVSEKPLTWKFNEDAKYLASYLESQSCLFVFWDGLKNYLDSSDYDYYSKKYDAHKREVDNYLSCASELAQIGKENNIELLIIKGIPFSEIIFGDIYKRTYHDVDCLINEKNRGIVHDSLIKKKFFHACGRDNVWTPFSKDKFKPAFQILPLQTLKDYSHHEYLEYYRKFGDTYCAVEIQRCIHQTVKDPLHVSSFLSHSQTITVGDICIETMDDEHIFLYLCENLYNSFTYYYDVMKLKDALDLYVFTYKYNNTLDWPQIMALSREYGMNSKTVRSWRLLNEIFHNPFTANKTKEFELLTIEERTEDVLFSLFEKRAGGDIFVDPDKRKKIDNILIDNYIEKASKKLIHKGQKEIDGEKYYYFNDDKYKFVICYRLEEVPDSQISLTVACTPFVFENLGQFEIIPQFIDVNKETEQWFKELVISKKGDTVEVKGIGEGCSLDPELYKVVVSKGYVFITIRIKKNNFKRQKDKFRFGFNLAFQEYVFRDRIAHVLGASNEVAWERKCFDAHVFE